MTRAPLCVGVSQKEGLEIPFLFPFVVKGYCVSPETEICLSISISHLYLWVSKTNFLVNEPPKLVIPFCQPTSIHRIGCQAEDTGTLITLSPTLLIGWRFHVGRHDARKPDTFTLIQDTAYKPRVSFPEKKTLAPHSSQRFCSGERAGHQNRVIHSSPKET